MSHDRRGLQRQQASAAGTLTGGAMCGIGCRRREEKIADEEEDEDGEDDDGGDIERRLRLPVVRHICLSVELEDIASGETAV